MEKEDSYSAPNFTTLDYHHHHHQQHHEGTSYLLNNLPQQQQQNQNQLSFADVMHFADFGPKLALNQTRISEEEDETDQSGIDPVYFLKFPVLNDIDDEERFRAMSGGDNGKDKEILRDEDDGEEEEEDNSGRGMNSVQLQFIGEDLHHANNNSNNNNNDVIANPSSSEPNNNNNTNNNNKNKRKRPRATKTSEEVESQRMTHIAVERNRRKQMNEHLRVLRALMPGSYVQRGDQASIIGGAIEFVRELEQLLQCLESQKRRRLLGDQNPLPRPADSAGSIAGGSVAAANNNNSNNNCLPPFFAPIAIDAASSAGDSHMQMKYVVDDFGGCGGGVREETAESKSCLADVEVKLLGFDAMIKILSRRRPGQLIKAIAALEDLQFNILHTNITTIEQTVLYSFNVKVTSESRFSAEDIASSVQQIFSFIHANSTI